MSTPTTELSGQVKQKRRKTNKFIIGGIVGFFILVAIGAASNGSNQSAASNTADTSSSGSSSSSQQSTADTTQTPLKRQARGTATTLGAGTFTGGKDVAVGLYDVTAGPGQSGNFIVSGTDSYNDILGPNSAHAEVPKIRVQISDGDQIQISGLSQVIFTPVTAPFVTSQTTTTLYAGTFIVGQDVAPGRYVATPVSGQSGNFIVSGNNSYNDILGSNTSYGEVPSLTVNLSNGDTVTVSGLSQVVMTPSR